MSKKKSILLIFFIVFIYLIYSNKYLLMTVFDYISRPKNTIVKEESTDSLDTDMTLEDFLINAEEKIEEPNKEPQKEEAPPNSNLEEPNNKKITIEDIKTVYLKDFSVLESSFKDNIDLLIEGALSDYKIGEASKMDIAKKYLKQGEILEKDSDKKFYLLLDQMKKALKSNQLPLDITVDIETYYQSYKKVEKNKLVEKGMSIVNKD